MPENMINFKFTQLLAGVGPGCKHPTIPTSFKHWIFFSYCSRFTLNWISLWQICRSAQHIFQQNWGQTYFESNRILAISHRNHNRIHRS